MSDLIGQKFVKNAKKKIECDILSNFQTMCASVSFLMLDNCQMAHYWEEVASAQLSVFISVFCKEKLMTSALLQIRVEAFPLWLHLCSSPPQFGKFGKGHLDETTLLLRSCRNVRIHTVKVSENFWDYFYYLLQWCRSRVPSFPSVIGANEGKSGQTSHHHDVSAKDTFCSHKNGLCIVPYLLL